MLCNRIALELDLDPDKVNKTVRSFFGHMGIVGQMKKGNTINLTGYGQFKPGLARRILLARKQRIKKALHRLKVKKYSRKKSYRIV